MKKSVLTALAILVSLGVLIHRSNAADSPVLAEMYGRGVHAYYAGDRTNANRYLSMAIDNGSKDPRAYYFRGMVAHSMGQPDQATSDWEQGAELEASGKANPLIGRSLARFQGLARIKLEEIRQNARLKALASGAARSQQRYDEIQAAEPGVLRTAPTSPPAAAAPPAAVAPPPAPENPFAEDGTPKVTADDALEGAMTDPFADDPAPDGAAPAAGADSNPFGGGGADPDPFGGGGDSDPFGGGGDSDPFGGGGDAGGAMDDPFGGGADPFGN